MYFITRSYVSPAGLPLPIVVVVFKLHPPPLAFIWKYKHMLESFNKIASIQSGQYLDICYLHHLIDFVYLQYLIEIR